MLTINMLHLTFENFASEIKKAGFESSIHNPKKNSTQWLGDGVYLYNDGDKSAIRQGKSLLKNKKTKPKDKIIGITFPIKIKREYILNLLNKEDSEFIKKYLKEKCYYFTTVGNYDLQESYLDFFIVLDHIDRFLPFNNVEYGNSLGDLINEFLEELEDVIIEMITCSFVTRSDFSGIENKAIEQHCIKNFSHLGDKESFKFIHV